MKNKSYFKINLIYFTAITSVAVLFVLSYFGIINNTVLSSFLIQCVVMAAIPMLMYTLMISKNTKSTLKDIGFKKISAKSIGIIILLGFILYLLNTYIATFFSGIIAMFGYERLPQAQTPVSNQLFLQEFILSAILPGICEEILHRGILLNCNKKVHNTHSCLVISSILFGLTHLNINQFFYAAILGYLMGYANLVADSIYPSIIIHFMNNFLSIYFSYGVALNWPLAKIFAIVETFVFSNFTVSIIISTLLIFTLINTYKILIKKLAQERAKSDIKNIVQHLRLNHLNIIEAQQKINIANRILKSKSFTFEEKNKIKPSFTDNIFLISAIVLGSLITICSFIWGII